MYSISVNAGIGGMRVHFHPAVERNIESDATITLDFALARLSNVVKNMKYIQICKNLNISKMVFFFSQKDLLELTSVGLRKKYYLHSSEKFDVWRKSFIL